MKIFKRATPQIDRNGKGQFVAGNRYRLTVRERNIQGRSYRAQVQPVSGKVLQYLTK